MQNEFVTLSPLLMSHTGDLQKIADVHIFKFFTDNLSNPENLYLWIQSAVEEKICGTKIPFIIKDNKSHRIAGTTSYGNISLKDQRLEIGWTWLGKEFQGRGINRQVKFLLLENAFEKMNYKRVEFKTDVLNKQSRKALEKIGAKEEGILRQHTKMHDGRWRDTVYYSILDSEWPEVKTLLTDY